jgi:hypothetical protein
MGGTDAIVFQDVSSADVVFSRSGNNLIVTGPSRTVTVVNYFVTWQAGRLMESLIFTDQTMAFAATTAAYFEDQIAAGGTTFGTTMNDTYLVPEVGPAASLREDNTGGTDTIVIEGFAQADVAFRQVGNNLTITTPNRVITVIDHFSGVSGRQFEQVQLTDGVLNRAAIVAALVP